MPYKSDRQRRWAHSPAGRQALGSEKLAEFDDASRGMELPEKVRHDKGPGHHLRSAGGNRGVSKRRGR